MDLLLDINSEIFPVEVGERYNIVLASSLSLHGHPDEGNVYDSSTQRSLLNSYDYAMYGRVFKFQEDKSSKSSDRMYDTSGNL